MTVQQITIKSIRIDGGTQSRVSIDEQVVANYAEAMTEGATLPPVIVFRDGANDWLADGFHRFHANVRIGAVTIDAEVRTGTQRDAVLFSVGANGKHGLPPSNADKRKAVMVLLNDSEWAAWSDREIAKRCHVSHPTVASARASLEKFTSEKPAERTYTTKHGTTATMDTSGQKQAAKERAAKAADTSTATETASTVTAEHKAPGPVTTTEAPAPPPVPAEDDLEAEIEAEMIREGEKALAEATDAFTKALDSDDVVGELTREVKRLTLVNAALQSRVDGLMNEKNAAIGRVRSLERKLTAIEKAGAAA